MYDTIPTILLLSFIAGVTPGPLMALIIGETLKHGKVAGIKIGIAPLLTDFPIMLVSILILSKLVHLDFLLGGISLLGACYLAYLAYGSITIKKVHFDATSSNSSLMKGIIANFLNPNPYIFYFTVLGRIMLKDMNINFLYGPLYVSVFLGVFILINIIIALSVDAAKQFFSSKKYVYTIRVLGIILLFFAYTFFVESLHFFGVLK